MFIRRLLATAIGLLIALAIPMAAGQAQRPARDTPAQSAGATASRAARISGRVLDAGTGRPVARARVILSAAELPGGRVALTDDSGVFDFDQLPAGRFTLSASKAAYIAVSYGQRRPLQGGTPLQLSDGQQLRRIDIALPRGSIISGTVRDEDGDPMPGAVVRVLRYQYVQGERQLVPAGSAPSDDRGLYRVWGLNPGEYFVTAAAPAPGGSARLGAARAGGAVTATSSDAPEAYAPTYYPGVPSAREAQPVTVGLGAELLNLDFSVLLVPVSRIAGRVIDSRGSPARGAAVALRLADTDGPGEIRSMGSRIGPDGTFRIDSIPPGRYMLSARAENDGVPAYSVQPFETGGGDVAEVSLVLTPGATLSGTVQFEGTGPRPGRLTISAPSADRTAFGSRPATVDIDADSTFSLTGVPPGAHWIRAQSPPGWILRSVVLDGRDVIDTPIEVRGSAKMGGIRMVFTDRISELNGTVTDQQRTPVTDYTALVFSTDADLWQPQSRHVMTARPDQNGRFQFRGLPPGSYHLAMIDPEQQGEWSDPRFLAEQRGSALRVNLAEGETRTQDLLISTP